MIILEYTPKGTPVSDFELGTTLASLKDGETYKFSTENIFYGLYCNILNGDVDYKNVMFKYGKYEVYVRESDMRLEFHRGGKVTDSYPEGFLEVGSLQKQFIYRKLMT